ncbi:uncharacterized protein LOC142560759 isoform X2 [Dermacentor variabilis]|uniref:uncharacterized protein LOC142560759 isoform X2 n=1 Tax=Dermacentor variabilis TaxID=34621 RepID=UPI003F5C9606
MFLLFLSCIFTIAAASPHGASEPFIYHKPNFTDLIEALNTSERIWMKNRNYSTIMDCIYLERIWLNKTDYFFYEWERKQSQRRKFEERAKLVNTTNVPVMKIRLKVEKEHKARPYEFQYWTSKEKCGIFTHRVSTPHTDWSKPYEPLMNRHFLKASASLKIPLPCELEQGGTSAC